jgi:transposase
MSQSACHPWQPDRAANPAQQCRCYTTARDMIEVARRWSVEVHENTIGAWLGELGLTRLQPRPVHPEKDPAADETFKKTSPAWRARRLAAARQTRR